MNTLPKETEERINKDTYDWGQLRLETGYATTIIGQKESYRKGALAEATRALPLLEALKKIQGICDHDDYGNASENCPVCIAKFAIEEYNQQ